MEDAPGEEGRWSAAIGGLGWCWHYAGGGGEGGLRKKQHPVVARPQQKSDPTEVNENNWVDLSLSEVCTEPFREKGTEKGEKFDHKTQKTVHFSGGGWQATPKGAGEVPVMKVITRGL